jgi:hypothetical protein
MHANALITGADNDSTVGGSQGAPTRAIQGSHHRFPRATTMKRVSSRRHDHVSPPHILVRTSLLSTHHPLLPDWHRCLSWYRSRHWRLPPLSPLQSFAMGHMCLTMTTLSRMVVTSSTCFTMVQALRITTTCSMECHTLAPSISRCVFATIFINSEYVIIDFISKNVYTCVGLCRNRLIPP